MVLAAGLILLAQAVTNEALFEALQSRHYTEALRVAARLIETHPQDPRLWTAKGLAYKGLGRTREGLAAFENALKFGPRYLPALEGAAEMAYGLRSPIATRLLKRVLDLQPGNETAHAMSGVVAFEAGDCAGAVSHFEKSAHAIDGNEIALSQFGFCLVSTGRPLEAAAAFSRALDMNPSRAETRYNLGLAYFLGGDAGRALSVLEPLREHSDFGSDVLNLMASAYLSEDRVREAIEALRRATEVAPRDERNYLDLAVICMEHQAPDLALEMVSVGLKNIPDSPRLLATRGAIYATLSQPAKAEADFQLARRLTPDELYSTIGLSLLFRQTDELERAVAILREKLRRLPDDPTLNYLLADALLRSEPAATAERSGEARSALQRSVRAKPDFAKAHAELGKIYLQDGETDRGIRELRLAIRLDPKDRVALQQLTVALFGLGQVEDAKQLAAQLREILQREHEDEKHRNSFRLAKLPPAR